MPIPKPSPRPTVGEYPLGLLLAVYVGLGIEVNEPVVCGWEVATVLALLLVVVTELDVLDEVEAGRGASLMLKYWLVTSMVSESTAILKKKTFDKSSEAFPLVTVHGK